MIEQSGTVKDELNAKHFQIFLSNLVASFLRCFTCFIKI